MAIESTLKRANVFNVNCAWFQAKAIKLLIFMYGDRTMKKMLTLVLVLGMASLASATVSMTLSGDNTPGSGTINLSVVPSSDQIDLQMAICIKKATGGSVGTLSLGTIGANAPTDSADTEASLAMLGNGSDATYGNGEIWTMTSFTSVYPEGVWLTVTYSGAVAGNTITAFQSADGNFDDVDLQSNTITIVPEPVTMALLGLGGLFLRRRK